MKTIVLFFNKGEPTTFDLSAKNLNAEEEAPLRSPEFQHRQRILRRGRYLSLGTLSPAVMNPSMNSGYRPKLHVTWRHGEDEGWPHTGK